jgi:hypothetical protein
MAGISLMAFLQSAAKAAVADGKDMPSAWVRTKDQEWRKPLYHRSGAVPGNAEGRSGADPVAPYRSATPGYTKA